MTPFSPIPKMSERLKKAKSKFGTKRVSRLEQLRLARINRGNGDTELPTAGSRGDASDAPAASAPVAVPVGNSARETRKLRLM